jgi:hypothetical protein
MRWIAATMAARVDSLKVRMFSSRTAWSEMMLLLEPASTRPTVSTANSPGATSRETTVCNRMTIEEASTTGSTDSCGIEPWLPRPHTVTRMLSPLERNGPGRTPSRPAGKGSTCWASATSGFGIRSARPASSITSAPSASSSAGWNRAMYVPFQASGVSASRRGSPEQARHVHIVPAGVHDRNHDAVPIGRVIRAGIRQPCHFLHGQGIHVGAHEHDRPVSVAQDADDTGRADLLVHVVAEPAQCVGDQGRGLDLLVAELGMLVERLVEVLLPGSDRLLPRENGRRISVLGHRWSLHTHRCHSTLLTPRCTSAGCTGPPSTATAVRPLP